MSRLDLRHALSALAALLVFALVYILTGDSDLMFAISSGLGAGVLFFLGAVMARGKR